MPKTFRSPTKAKLAPLSIRTTQETRFLMEAAANASGRSLTAEVEHRLVASFQRDAGIDEMKAALRAVLDERGGA